MQSAFIKKKQYKIYTQSFKVTGHLFRSFHVLHTIPNFLN